jgi:hypothetical protein
MELYCGSEEREERRAAMARVYHAELWSLS